jgi:hypothetical protein
MRLTTFSLNFVQKEVIKNEHYAPQKISREDEFKNPRKGDKKHPRDAFKYLL